MALIVAILGAESTGKTQLANELGEALAGNGLDVAVVTEYLREFCDTHGRTPRVEEQRGIAAEQARRIAAAAALHDIVVADTTALMVAVYSDMIFGDTSLYESALKDHRDPVLTLVTALDLPWQADGILRDGPHVREPVNRLLRAALHRAEASYSVISGFGTDRLASALTAVRHALNAPNAAREAAANPKWQWLCDRCSDGDCERHILLAR